jgi:Rrf2 family protein
MVEIGRRYGGDPVKRREIAEAQDLSMGFLENILVVLKDNGLIEPIRGMRGGFTLKRAPSQIRMFDIVKALEGSTAPVDCLESTQVCERIPDCPARVVWRKVHEAQNQVLESYTVQDMLDIESESAENYVI